MSITLSGTIPLENASIQYTYPEMDIRGIVKTNNIITFKFRNGLSSSSFSFTDIDASTFISGITMEGTISTGKHTFDSNTTYPLELTIKHIKSSDGLPFYVVFPIASGGKTSFINSISDSTDTDINVINMSDADNKSLNSMIGDEYSSTFYKYINNNDVLVFVFKKPITMSMNNNKIPNVTSAHSLWSGVKLSSNIQTPIYMASNDVVGGKVSEEIVCDYSGDTVQTINNEPLNRGAAKIGWTTFVFILLAVWIGYFYSIDFINKNLINFNLYGLLPIIINIIVVVAVFAGVYGSNKKLSMYTSPEAILIFVSLLWPIDFVFRSVVYLILIGINSISSFDSDLNNYKQFIGGYLNGDATTTNANKFAKYAISALFMVWIIAIFAIVSK
jgi:hypothetical protein